MTGSAIVLVDPETGHPRVIRDLSFSAREPQPAARDDIEPCASTTLVSEQDSNPHEVEARNEDDRLERNRLPASLTRGRAPGSAPHVPTQHLASPRLMRHTGTSSSRSQAACRSRRLPRGPKARPAPRSAAYSIRDSRPGKRSEGFDARTALKRRVRGRDPIGSRTRS